MGRPQSRAIGLVALLVVSTLTVGVGAVGGAAASSSTTSAASSPGGFVGVSDSQIDSDLPPNTPMGDVAARLKGEVLASSNASTLNVTVTNPGRAKKYSDGAILGGGPVAIILSDDTHHEGREVALPADVLRDVLGYVPHTAYGTHEDGSQWTRSTRVEDGSVIFSVPHFSDNTVTFASEVNLTGSPAVDGTQYEYNLTNTSATTDPVVNLTGITNTENETVSDSGVRIPGSVDPAIAGNIDPTGPSANNTPTITLTGLGEQVLNTSLSASPNGGADYGNSLVYVGQGSTLAAYYAGNHTQKWNVSYASSVRAVDYHNGRVYLGLKDQQADTIALDASDGSQLWRSEDGDDWANGIVATNDGSHVMTTMGKADPNTTAIYDKSGTLIGLFDETDSPTGVAASSSTFFTGLSDGNVTARAETDGSLNWKTDVGTRADSAAYYSGDVYVGLENGYLVKLDPTDGTVLYNRSVSDISRFGSLKVDGANGQLLASAQNSSDAWVGARIELDAALNATYPENGGAGRSGVAVDGRVVHYPNTGTDSLGKWDGPPAENITVSQNGTAFATGVSLAKGESTTVEAALSLGGGVVNLTDGQGQVDVTVELTERAETVDPAVEVNDGNWLNHSGKLADGETVSLTGNSSWLVEGANTVNVSLSDSSTTTEPPGPGVSLVYTHEAERPITTDYTGTKWEESYNVTTQYVSDRSDVTLRINFDGNVVEVGDVTVLSNGTEQSAQDITMTDGTLYVTVGDVTENEEIAVNATGRKVVVQNGEIDVVGPTIMGDKLSTEFEVVSRSTGFGIDVSGTADGNEIHHLASASYTTDDFVGLDPGGSQVLYLPNAAAGSTATVETIPLSIAPEGGGVEVIVEEPTEPRFTFRHGNYSANADDVTVTWRAPIAGETYRVYSVSRSREVVASDATDTVSFYMAANEGIYKIEEKPEQTSTVTAVNSGSNTAQGVSNLTLLTLFGGMAGAILLFAIVSRRYLGLTGRAANYLVLVGGAVVGFTGVELATPRSVLSDLIFAGGNALGNFASSSAGSVLIALTLLAALFLVDRRVLDLPQWFELIGGGLVVMWSLTQIVPGAIGSGLETVSPLMWLVLGVGSVYLLAKAIGGPTFVIDPRKRGGSS